eukprot:jgi/Chlat1/787/Chrsp104S01311
MPLHQPDSSFVRIRSSVDLTAAAARLRSQLLEVRCTVPAESVARRPSWLRLCRYEAYWLPLTASASEKPTSIAPPVDVQWVPNAVAHELCLRHAARVRPGLGPRCSMSGSACMHSSVRALPGRNVTPACPSRFSPMGPVALPHYCDTKVFLLAAVEPYRQF